MDRSSELAKIEKFFELNQSVKERLQKVDDLTFMKLLSPLILLVYAHNILYEAKDSIILTTLYISTLEALQSVKGGKRFVGKDKLISSFLNNNLDNDQKISLLRSFTFSHKYEFKNGELNSFHLMREDYKKSSNYYPEYDDKYCETGGFVECICVKWLRSNPQNIDRYIKRLAKRFYEMRSAVLHDGSGVLWFHDFQNDSVSGTFSGTLFDAYSSSKDGKFVSYASGIRKDEFYSIIKYGIKNFLSSF